MQEQWQLYDEQGRPIAGRGAAKNEIFCKGLLHGASHVWIWRIQNGHVEVLLQKRAAGKRTWPNLYDVSAAGHIDLGEAPLTAAVREAKEEIGISIGESSLIHVGVHRALMVAPNNAIEHEFQWLYVVKLTQTMDLTAADAEVAALAWKPLTVFQAEVLDASTAQVYVPHGRLYFETVVSAIERAAKE